ncbi:AMP-binding protein [Thiothrix subterranea]|uniref:AMP-binding protein n=1 Tax=Thiothrix subterranea TaxID=2735563 RepID=A0AA51MKM2_9GAMM|nr:AMP-binding protein [Thiothrix subterranea]MDQ5770967.1 AMP-binding protein [Thiothrix subterranea]WML85923.1 AMP-binding protein [Thiothrix subterranea]
MDFHSIWRNLKKFKNNDFLTMLEYRLNYGDLIELINRLVTLFDEYNILPSSRVIILTHNEGAAIVGFIASLLDGVVPIMLTPDTPHRRVASIVNSTEPALVIIDDSRLDEDWIKQIPARIVIHDSNSYPRKKLFSFSHKRSAMHHCGLDLPTAIREPHLPEVNDDLAYILFTSGTTQAPSGVMISRKNIIANLQTISRLFGCNSNARLFNDMALAHADGLVQGILLAMANAATLIRSGGFKISNLENWLNRVRQEKATHFITAPTIWSFIDQYANHDDYFDSSECLHLISVAAKLEQELWGRLQNRFGKSISNQYGLTETVTSALYSGDFHSEMGGFGSIGKPVDCEARIRNTDDVDSEIGELQLHGDNIFLGYWKNSKRTTETFTQDGWMRTGDLVQSCSDGSYKILGRLKTIIMSGGFLIRPEEIDEVLLTHPSVIEAVTVSMPDPNFDEVPVTAVVLSDERTDEDTLLEYARSNLEALKVPKRIISLASIPRGDAGKPKLKELREELLMILSRKKEYTQERNSRDVSGEVYQITAQVLHIDPQLLQPDSSPASVRSWDSFSQIALIIAMESHFSIRIPVAKAASIRNLGELVTTVKDLLK